MSNNNKIGQVPHRTQNALRGSFPVIGPGSISGLGETSFATTHVEKHEELNLFFPSSFSIILPGPDHVSAEAKGLEVLNYTSKQKDTKKMFTQEEWPVSDAVVTAARHMSGTLTLLTLHQVLCSAFDGCFLLCFA